MHSFAILTISKLIFIGNFLIDFPGAEYLFIYLISHQNQKSAKSINDGQSIELELHNTLSWYWYWNKNIPVPASQNEMKRRLWRLSGCWACICVCVLCRDGGQSSTNSKTAWWFACSFFLPPSRHTLSIVLTSALPGNHLSQQKNRSLATCIESMNWITIFSVLLPISSEISRISNVGPCANEWTFHGSSSSKRSSMKKKKKRPGIVRWLWKQHKIDISLSGPGQGEAVNLTERGANLSEMRMRRKVSF